MRRYLIALMLILLVGLLFLFWPWRSPVVGDKSQVYESTVATYADLIAPLSKVQLTANEESEVDALAWLIPPPWTGDLDGMRKSGVMRILVPLSKTYFLVDKGRTDGLMYQYGKAFETWLNKNKPLGRRSERWHVLFIPTESSQLLPRLLAGLGDVAAGALTITAEREKQVDFTLPIETNVREAFVTGPGAPKLERLEDVAGREVYVRNSSSYFFHLQALNARLMLQGLAPLKIMPVNEQLESDDLLQLVNAGMFGMTVVDRYIAELWRPIYTDLVIHDQFYLHEGSEVAWALRKNSPQLKQALNHFIETHKMGTRFGSMMRTQYIESSAHLLNAGSKQEVQRFNALVGYFTKHAATYDFDYLMLMAQGFQESGLNQKARSHRGAVGVMQVMPATARYMGIKDVVVSADRNIEAGSKYMRYIADTYLDDPEITSENRLLLACAGYNAGPGNLLKFRRLAEKSGLDKNVWFGNVEQGAARIIGRETVDYVGNVYKYYMVYRFSQEKLRLREAARKN